MSLFDFKILKSGQKSDEPRTILVVDDDDLLKPFMARMLYSIDSDIDLIWATNLTQARAAVETRKVDLIISDCLLSERESGFEFWKFCKENYKQIPFVMISGLGFDSIERMGDGLRDWPPLMHKPLMMQESRDFIRSFLPKA